MESSHLARRGLHEGRLTPPSEVADRTGTDELPKSPRASAIEAEPMVQQQDQVRPLEETSTPITERKVKPFPVEKEHFKPPKTVPPFPAMNFIRPDGYNTCFISSALQFLGRMLDDDYLNRLIGAQDRYHRDPNSSGCPPALLAGKSKEDQNAVIQNWLHFQELFCEAMVMVRQPSGEQETVPEGFMDEFLKRLRRLGRDSGHQRTCDLLGREETNSKINQTDVCEFLRCLDELLGLTDEAYDWKGAVKLQDDQRAVVGKLENGQNVYVDMRQDKPEFAPFHLVSLPYQSEHDPTNYFEKCLAPTVAKDPKPFSKNDAEIKIRDAFDEIRFSNPALSEEVEQKLHTLQVKPGYPLETGTNIYLKPDCDSISIRLNMTARESDVEPGSYDLQKESGGIIPEKLSYTTDDEAFYMRDKTTGKKYVVKMSPIGGVDAEEKDSRQHAQASRLARKFYEIAGAKVLKNSTVTKIYESDDPDKNGEPKILSVTEDPAETPEQCLDCRPNEVSRVLDSKDWRGKEYIIFDAWLGNLGIVNGRSGGLGLARVEFHSSTNPDILMGESHELCRTEFECFGYKYKEAERGIFANTALLDLNALLDSKLFKDAGITKRDLEYGKRLLKKMTDNVIKETIWGSGFADKEWLIDVLISRRDSIKNDTFGDGEDINALDSMNRRETNLEFSPDNGCRKLTKEAVRALQSSRGEIELQANELIEGDETREAKFTGKAKSIVCHAGSTLSEGHYITLQRYHDTWFVLDDCLKYNGKPAGMVPVWAYIRMLDPDYKSDSPNGIDNVIALFKIDDDRKFVPYLVGYERNKGVLDERSLQRATYEQHVVEAYHTAHPQFFPQPVSPPDVHVDEPMDKAPIADTGLEQMEVSNAPVLPPESTLPVCSESVTSSTQEAGTVTVQHVIDNPNVTVEPVLLSSARNNVVPTPMAVPTPVPTNVGTATVSQQQTGIPAATTTGIQQQPPVTPAATSSSGIGTRRPRDSSSPSQQDNAKRRKQQIQFIRERHNHRRK
ncbi:hypothetical protein M3P05_13215 [Sansalvadorimonas sp. 2012CJ34-2]|uniref:USP domain-containing protein n=1 Tax=Parendozoicomonas callyspongiae TaxID=2942213 RepID=A0ABT0PK99_9GAMM|nr:hypothetical protein [Sansalvadorimonas sp. 2012CJ34-2]MCL6270883.1 hypothetical protein [Sansalvadorimonas sp. 2012CJ34-2]